MSSESNIWKKLQKGAELFFNKGDDEDCSKEKRKAVRRLLSKRDQDLDARMNSLRNALKAGKINKKQFRTAKKLILSSYE
ncbi:MAG: hypothetical protein HQL67_02030 [Magnetococcales bacterium]|nr:hypothetical protein [Magnetococcales bacterium]